MEFLGDSNELAAADVLVFVREAVQRFDQLRLLVIKKLLDVFSTIKSMKLVVSLNCKCIAWLHACLSVCLSYYLSPIVACTVYVSICHTVCHTVNPSILASNSYDDILCYLSSTLLLFCLLQNLGQ